MDFQFFESLSPAEAEEFLNNFLNTERKAIGEMIDAARAEGVQADLTVTSVAQVLKWVLRKVRTIPRLPDEKVPSWIRETDSYSQSLFDFDEPSRILILRAAYYLGVCFVNYSERLRWSVGDAKTAHQNMPVVTGFSFHLELAPMMIVENLFSRIIRGAAGDEAIDVAIKHWLDKVPG